MSQNRNWCLTINNPTETDEEFFEYVKSLQHLKYVVFQREAGEKTKTPHFQIYIEFSIGKRFETMKSLFPRAYIDKRRGSKDKARSYCMKETKETTLDDGTADFETRISGPYEYGDFVESGERSDLHEIVDMLENSATDNDIRRAYPTHFLRYSKNIQQYRQSILEEKYSKTFRELEIIYISGSTEKGKTRYVMDKYGYTDVYRVTSYDHSAFDNYKGEPVIAFEEFRSSFKIEDMLKYLEGYPLMLPCRYNNKVACYTTVYIITNWALHEQYKNVQVSHPSTWHAFLRRIKTVYNFDKSKDTPIPFSKRTGQPLQSIANLIPLSGEEAGELPF